MNRDRNVDTALGNCTFAGKAIDEQISLSRSKDHVRLPETIELKHATRGVNIFLLSKLGCETFGSQLLYLWEIPVNKLFTAVTSSWDSSPRLVIRRRARDI